MTIYLDYTNVKTEGCSPREDSHVDEAILTWPWATLANFPAAFSVLVEVRQCPHAAAGCCAAVLSSAPDDLAHDNSYSPAEQPAWVGEVA